MSADTPRSRVPGGGSPSGLARTASKLGDGHRAVFPSSRSTTATLEELEDLLIAADIGVDTAARSRGSAERRPLRSRDCATTKCAALIAGEIEKVLRAGRAAASTSIRAKKPFVILVAGVNGSGKTTTIGKLAAKLIGEG